MILLIQITKEDTARVVENNMKEINRFRGKYFFLSNFYPCEFDLPINTSPISLPFSFFEEVHYKCSSSEQAYQALKFVWAYTNVHGRVDQVAAFYMFDAIMRTDSPSHAKQLAKGNKSLWEKIPELEKLHIMEKVVREKFEQNDDLRYNLIETGEAKLVEGNNWGDTFWVRWCRPKQTWNNFNES